MDGVFRIPLQLLVLHEKTKSELSGSATKSINETMEISSKQIYNYIKLIKLKIILIREKASKTKARNTIG